MGDLPYIISDWVKGEHFYGRGQLCQALAARQERCVYLAGTRRIGKTSLMLRLAAQLSPHAIYCDLMRAGGGEQLDEARLVALMRRQLAQQSSASPQLRASRADWDRETASLCGWLEEVSWRWEELGISVTLLWDEAELLRRLPTATLMPLRAILQHSESLRAIVCASKGLADLNERWRDDFVSPFLFGFRTCYIAGLSDEEADELIRQRGRVAVASRSADIIRAWSGNHPFLLQSLCGRLYDGGRLREPDEHDLHVDAAMAGLFHVDASYLSPSEQAILSALARQGALAPAELAQHTGLAGEAIHSFAAGMAELGMLRLTEGRWRVGSEFLALWARMQPAPLAAITDLASLEVIDPELQQLELARAEQRRRARAIESQPRDAAPVDGALSDVRARIAAIDRQLARRSEQIAPAQQPLSERERAVLRLVAAGLTNQEIARELTIALDTVKAHLKHISEKLGAANRAQAVARAQELGLL